MRILLALSFLTMLSCARPDYITAQDLARLQNQESHCPLKFAQNSLCASVHWTQGPASSNESEFILKFWNITTATEEGPFVDPNANLNVVLWMPSMGHGSSPVTLEKIETGTYRIRRVYFIMPGEWEIRFILKNSAGVMEQTTVSLTL